MDGSFVRSAGLMLGTTVGAGLFALPFLFSRAGWLMGGIYLAVFAAVIHFAQRLYYETLLREEGRRLVGLASHHYGRAGRELSLMLVVGGLMLTLVAYLVLVESFLTNLSPDWGGGLLFAFWLLATVPVLFRIRRFAAWEFWGTVGMVFIILGVFAKGVTGEISLPLFEPAEFFLPFGAVLFALSGWPAVEPIREFGKRNGFSLRESVSSMAWGTGLASVFYFLFVIGIAGSALAITPDAISGLAWPAWQVAALLVLGLFAVWTSYVPIGLEIRNTLSTDFAWSERSADVLVFFLPPALLLLGFRDFLGVVSLVGGVFLGLEYFLILRIARKVLRLPSWKTALVRALEVLFVLAAVYEIWYFIFQN